MLVVDDDTITLTTPARRRRRAQEIAARYTVSGTSIVDEFLAEKRADAEHENRTGEASALNIDVEQLR